MKDRFKRVSALVLALVILVTTCFASLPEGSLSFLGNVGEQIVSLFGSEEAEAATTNITLHTYCSTSKKITTIGRNEGFWTFTTGTGYTVFCQNSGKSLTHADTYSYTEKDAKTYSNKSKAKALTWYFGEVGEGSKYYYSSSSLGASYVQVAVQAYIWATCESANKEDTVEQCLSKYCNVSDAATWATRICNAISATSPYGTIVEYTLSSCGHSPKKSADDHQAMIGWYYNGVEPKTDKVTLSDTRTGSTSIWWRLTRKTPQRRA